jgi:hypothetical protein
MTALSQYFRSHPQASLEAATHSDEKGEVRWRKNLYIVSADGHSIRAKADLCPVI